MGLSRDKTDRGRKGDYGIYHEQVLHICLVSIVDRFAVLADANKRLR